MVLQLLDSLIPLSIKLLQSLRSQTSEIEGVEFFLSIDNKRNPCCVDYISADHIEADLIVKFGESCLCEKKDINVLFIFNKEVLDLQKFKASIMKEFFEDIEDECPLYVN